MTLDEAIAKAKADGDVQLAEWLRQARGADAAARWYTEKLRDANRTIRKLLDENAKLRNEVDNLLDFEHLTSVAVAYAGCDECGEYKQTMIRLFAENYKLREFAAHMANALGIDSEWCDPEWCDSDCMDEFKCRPTGDYGEIHCPAFARMTELGIEVTS